MPGRALCPVRICAVVSTPCVVVRILLVICPLCTDEDLGARGSLAQGEDCRSPSGPSICALSHQADCIPGRITERVHITTSRGSDDKGCLRSHFHCGTRGVGLEGVPRQPGVGSTGSLQRGQDGQVTWRCYRRRSSRAPTPGFSQRREAGECETGWGSLLTVRAGQFGWRGVGPLRVRGGLEADVDGLERH